MFKLDYYSLYDYKLEDDWLQDQLIEESYREEKRPTIGKAYRTVEKINVFSIVPEFE